MRSLAAGRRLTVRLSCAAASLLRPPASSRMAATAAMLTATPAIAPRFAVLFITPPKPLNRKVCISPGCLKRPRRSKRGGGTGAFCDDREIGVARLHKPGTADAQDGVDRQPVARAVGADAAGGAE